MANRDEIVDRMEKLQAEIEQAVSSMPEDGWSRGVYEGGWNARQLLAHIASTSRVVGFILGMARVPSPPTLGPAFDEDAFNAPQVAARERKSKEELLGEIKANFERDMAAVRSVPDDLIAKNWKAPWGVEGEVGDVIVMSLKGHLGMHLTDLRSAAGS